MSKEFSFVPVQSNQTALFDWQPPEQLLRLMTSYCIVFFLLYLKEIKY